MCSLLHQVPAQNPQLIALGWEHPLGAIEWVQVSASAYLEVKREQNV